MAEIVIKVLSEQLNIPINEIAFDSKIALDLGADSLDIVEIVLKLEDIYGAHIPDEDVMAITTVSDICDYIKRNGLGN